MKARCAALIVLIATALSSCTKSPVDEMADRAKESRARDQNYERISAREFWGDMSYMEDCVPKNSPMKPFDLYFEVLPDGKLGEMIAEPSTSVSTCIERHVSGRVFSLPPKGLPYVTKVGIDI